MNGRDQEKSSSHIDIENGDRLATPDTIVRTAELERSLSEHTATAGALRSCQDRYRAVMESTSLGIVTMTADGRIESFNRAAEHIFGYPAAAVLGKPVPLLIPERLRAAHQSGLQRYLETRLATIIGHTVEFPGLRCDGVEIPIVLTITTIEREPALLFIAVIQLASGWARSEQQ